MEWYLINRRKWYLIIRNPIIPNNSQEVIPKLENCQELSKSVRKCQESSKRVSKSVRKCQKSSEKCQEAAKVAIKCQKNVKRHQKFSKMVKICQKRVKTHQKWSGIVTFGEEKNWKISQYLKNFRIWHHLHVFSTPPPSFFVGGGVQKKFKVGKIQKSFQPKCDTTSKFLFSWRRCKKNKKKKNIRSSI